MKLAPTLAFGLLCGCLVGLVRAEVPAEISSEASTPVPPLDDKGAGLAAQGARLAAVQAELEILPDVEASLRETLVRDVRALYRLKRGGLLAAAGGLRALMSHASRVSHLERMSRRTLRELAKTEASERELGKERTELELAIARGQRELVELEAARRKLAQEAQLASRADADIGDPLEGERVGYGLTLTQAEDASEQRASFSRERGALALPLAAPGEVRSEDGIMHFSAQAGASVRAAASGRVAQVEERPEGGLVVLDHGRGYRTWYRGVARIDVQLGDHVSKSARLGSVGEDALSFGVQRGTRSQDARSWLGL